MPICLRLSAFLLVSKSRTALKSVREPPTRRHRTGPPPYHLARARGQTGALFPSSPTTACFTLKLSSSQQRQWRKLFPSRIISLSRLLGLNLYICVCTHTRRLVPSDENTISGPASPGRFRLHLLPVDFCHFRGMYFLRSRLSVGDVGQYAVASIKMMMNQRALIEAWNTFTNCTLYFHCRVCLMFYGTGCLRMQMRSARL